MIALNLADIALKLAEPFPPELVSWRVGKRDGDHGLALCYIRAPDVMKRLDDVCGIDNWECHYVAQGDKTICEIGIRLGTEPGPAAWVWKANGAGDTKIEAEKGALSDAFKRAAVMWGIGRYLYEIEGPWVKLRGTNIADEEWPRLRALIAGVPPPSPTGGPSDEDAERQRARDAYARVKKGILAAKTNRNVSETLTAYKDDLALIERLHPDSHRGLMDLATKRNDQLR